ncbi:kinase-like protein [Lepidopterella palustris CBS 459.81]|uniref:Kinase-like protein n=1 Tax=Lepidopterella palustris CBS 459.81 TaxID=1314670 RepID=A0A8E2DX15_9PEZI|nr:kinase-like protein [Lepidopterella palustris CBS 459.81]
MEPKTTVLEIGSWISASNDANFSDTHPVTSSVHDFYSLPGTSLYTTIVDILLPATKAQLPCLSRDELYHSVGPPLSGGEGSQFETFSSHIRKLPSQTKQISTIIKCIRRRKEDYASGTANRRISDIIRSLKDIMKEFQFLCHEPFRNHPNIVKLLAYGWEPDFAAPVLVLELADLGNLENYLKNTSSLSFDMKREICLDIAAGLDILHAAHVVHGDLKPRNILMFRKEKQGTQSVQAKLSDFGLSTGDLDRDEAAYNGTTLWNPPEAGEKTRIRAQDLSSCDIFSLGLIIWTVLKQGEDYMDGAWFPPSTDDRFQKVLDSALLPRFRGLSLEHIKNMKPCFRRNEDDAKEALAVKNLGSNGLLKQASQYLDAIDISRSEIFGGDPEILKQCFAQAFDGTLQDDPKARKSAAEIMKILDISNMRSSVPRDFTAQDYKLVAYDKQESSFILVSIFI